MKYLIKDAAKLKKEWNNGEIVEVVDQSNGLLLSQCVEKGWLEPYDGDEPNKHVQVIAAPFELSIKPQPIHG